MSPRRTRRGVTKQDITTPVTEKKGKKATVSPKEKSRSPPKKRITRAAKTKVTSDSEDKPQKFSKKLSRKKPAKTEADSLITEDESVTESPRASSRLGHSLISEDESTPPNRAASQSSVARLDLTPKSSPISVTLTPHRSTKTPRRSPENFGSPKTHSGTPLRLSKTPRKLDIKDSPTSSEESQLETNERTAGSKSPSSRSKPKSPTPKKSPTLTKARKSTAGTVTRNKQSPNRINESVSGVSKKIASKSSRRSLSASKLKRSPAKFQGSTSPKFLSKVAVVMLEKLEDSTGFQNSTPISTPLPVLGDASPKRPKSTAKKRSFVTDLGTPLKPIPMPKNPRSSLKNIILETQEQINSARRQTKKDLIINFSTPKEGLRCSVNLLDSLEEASPLVKKKSSSSKNRSRSFSAIENESEPAISDTSLINMSDVFDSDVSQKEEKKDGTYEVIEPKTPNLQSKKTRKRSSPNATLNRNETESKKVRFAESEIVTDSNVVKLRSGTPGYKLSMKRTSEVRSKSKSPQRLSKGLGENVRRRSSSVSIIEGTPRTPANKKINSMASLNLKSDSKTQMASVNRLSRPRLSIASEKKPDTKTPVPRKIPNFAEIHKKTFAKMESLVDAKKRVAERHVAMVNPLIVSTSKSNPEVALGKRLELSNLPSSSQLGNGAYNRFGFKVRKNEAVESVTKKQSTMTSEKKKSARREILKGVRTNRRFELQMKTRKSLSSK